jgi:hypothetical protein
MKPDDTPPPESERKHADGLRSLFDVLTGEADRRFRRRPILDAILGAAGILASILIAGLLVVPELLAESRLVALIAPLILSLFAPLLTNWLRMGQRAEPPSLPPRLADMRIQMLAMRTELHTRLSEPAPPDTGEDDLTLIPRAAR